MLWSIIYINFREEYPLINETYEPILKKFPEEKNSLDCLGRIQGTLTSVLENYDGKNFTKYTSSSIILGNILIVSHGSPIAACHKVLSGEFKYVGLCTISKYNIERVSSNTNLDENGNIESDENLEDMNGNQKGSEIRTKYAIKRLLAGDTNHLSDKTNLRDVPKFLKKSGNVIAVC